MATREELKVKPFDKGRITHSTAMLSDEVNLDTGEAVYRYSLGRRWDGKWDYVLWLMLNPSIADATVNDPTVTRCMGFSDGWGFHGIQVANCFAYRATEPKDLVAAKKAGIDIVGPENDRFLRAALTDTSCSLVVAGWGANALATPRGIEIKAMVAEAGRSLLCIGWQPRDTFPRHPLYLPGDSELELCP